MKWIAGNWLTELFVSNCSLRHKNVNLKILCKNVYKKRYLIFFPIYACHWNSFKWKINFAFGEVSVTNAKTIFYLTIHHLQSRWKRNLFTKFLIQKNAWYSMLVNYIPIQSHKSQKNRFTLANGRAAKCQRVPPKNGDHIS